MKKREANFELLRIVAMYMIIILHYLVKGDAVLPYTVDMSGTNMLVWLLESLAICAVNCYVLLSGYFLIDAQWKAGRIVTLLCRVLFYSLGIPVVLLVIGVKTIGELSVYDLINYLFPVGTECYWFVTAYVMMYLFAPILGAGIKALTKKQLQIILLLLIFFQALEKTILPIHLATDRFGYDYGWFMTLFILAAYIRLYGISRLEKKSAAILVYGGSVAAIWLISFLAAKTGMNGLTYYIDMPYCYNYLFVLTAAVGLFFIFKNISLKDSVATTLICKVGPLTLGVYLLHEHPLIRYQWPIWLGVSQNTKFPGMLLHMILTAGVIFICGILVDYVRSWLFVQIGKLYGKIFQKERSTKVVDS